MMRPDHYIILIITTFLIIWGVEFLLSIFHVVWWISIPTSLVAGIINYMGWRRYFENHLPRDRDQTKKSQRDLLRVGHQMIKYLPIFFALEIFIDGSGLSWRVTAFNIIGVFFLLSAIYLLSRHDSKLCESCIEETPINGEQLVEVSWRRKCLHMIHLLNSLRMMIFILTGFFAVQLLFSLIADRHYISHLLSNIITAVLTDLWCLLYWTADRQHRRLIMWCPWCHWGNGGDYEEVPDPSLPEKV